MYRNKKIGENNPLSIELKEKYKSNFDSILMNLINTKTSNKTTTNKLSLCDKLIEPEVEIEIKKQINPEKKTTFSNSTSEESSEDYFEKARIFSEVMINKEKEISDFSLNKMSLKFKREPILLKKNSFLAFADNFDEYEDPQLLSEDPDSIDVEDNVKIDLKSEVEDKF